MDALVQELPYLTADLPGLGGRIKTTPEDFVVEEIPAYEPSGSGPFLYLWIEKRDLGAEFFIRQVARRLGVKPGEVGTAGLKDRQAVTRQWVSVPVQAEPRLAELEGEGLRLLQVSRHGNKLKPGHLRGNRFTIRIRDVSLTRPDSIETYVQRLRRIGLANFYGSQRFGKDGETLRLGLQLLGFAPLEGAPPRPSRFLRKLALSAVQSAVFNLYLARRLNDGLLHTVLEGDVMARWPFGGMFVAQDVAAEQARFDRREIVHTGPMFGKKMKVPTGVAAEREEAALRESAIQPNAFAGFGKLLEGTRRHNLIWIDDLAAEVQGADVTLRFSLPAGSYATILLRELMKAAEAEGALQETGE